MTEQAVFLLFAAVAVASALLVVLHRNPVYSVLSLAVTMVAIAGLFVLLGSPLLAALQVLIYTGAILVLFLFVIMLLSVGREAARPGVRWGSIGVAFIAAATFVALLAVSSLPGASAGGPLTAVAVAVRPLARSLFTVYLLPFEVVGLLLLAAVIAATVLARRPSGSAPAAAPEGEP